ncbi:MAG: hypothetical protein ACTSYS_14050 [Promethearchaeota archaeon]
MNEKKQTIRVKGEVMNVNVNSIKREPLITVSKTDNAGKPMLLLEINAEYLEYIKLNLDELTFQFLSFLDLMKKGGIPEQYYGKFIKLSEED